MIKKIQNFLKQSVSQFFLQEQQSFLIKYTSNCEYYRMSVKLLIPGFINLLKTIIGSGILYIPMLFNTFGVIPTIILMILSCSLSITGQIIYIYCNFNLHNRNSNLTNLAKKSIPNISILMDFFVFFKCFGVSTSYLIIIRELLPGLVSKLFEILSFQNDRIVNFITDQKVALFLFLLFIGPITFFKELKRLKYTSFLGLLAIFVILISSIGMYVSKIKSYDLSSNEKPEIEYEKKDSNQRDSNRET
ncbi:Amino Acid/Auxin Permease (AAAP) Family, partial [Pseudoloma neurophilia]